MARPLDETVLLVTFVPSLYYGSNVFTATSEHICTVPGICPCERICEDYGGNNE